VERIDAPSICFASMDIRSLELFAVSVAAQEKPVATTADTYRGTKIAQAAVHCDNLVRLSGDAAKEATAAAEMHKQLAGVAGNCCHLRPGRRFRWPRRKSHQAHRDVMNNLTGLRFALLLTGV
jgi:hypothetical protein